MNKKHEQSGFTLIELVVVIVILGILAATALPKFVDLTTDAEKAAANGVLGAARGACAMTFAQHRAQSVTTGYITDGATLLAALSPAPVGWSATTVAINHTGKNTTVYSITVAAETATDNCTLTPTAGF